MNVNELFIEATRKKYRFPFKGAVTVEDLWDLGLTDLDSIFKKLNSKVRANQEDSLLTNPSSEDSDMCKQIDIIRYIVSVKQEEANKKIRDMENKAKRERIEQIIANKQDDALNDMSIEDLTKMLEKIR